MPGEIFCFTCSEPMSLAQDEALGQLFLCGNGHSVEKHWGKSRVLITTTRTQKASNPKNGPGIFGNLAIDASPFKCVFMERDGAQIQPGTYPIKWLWSNHFNQFMPHLIVPGRVAIEQHWANYPNQLEGCQAIGTEEDLAQDCIEESKNAWKEYCAVIINEPNVMLKVVEDYGT